MKTLKPFLFLLFLLPLMGCEALEELIEEEFDEDISFILSFDVAADATGNPDESVSLNTATGSYFITEDPNISQFISSPDEIKKIKINSIQYEYKNFTGNVDAEIISSFSIGVAFGLSEIFNTPLTNVARADLLGDRFTLNGNLDKVSDFALSSGGILIQHGGSATHNPVNFNTEVTVHATVTIQVDVDNF